MATFELQIVTPGGCKFDGEAEKLIARAINGDVCILARHTRYVTALATGEVRVTMDGKARRAACSGGMLSVLDNHVRLVAPTFEWSEDIDAQRAEQARARAERILRESKDDTELELAKAKLCRALNRLDVAR